MAALQCRNGEVRLVDGNVPNEGRVEICFDEVWGVICNENWMLMWCADSWDTLEIVR